MIGELPAAGTEADARSKVSLTVSSGPGSVPVPTSIVGDTLKQAKKALHHAGLKPGHIFDQASKQFADGQVITTNPAPGQAVALGSAVNLFVSTGPPKVNLPDVTGESEGQAKSDLHNAGFENITTTTQTSNGAQSGTVLSQSPTGGSLVVPSATTVNLVIAKAIPKVSVPTVLGQSAGSATSQLQAEGFAVVQKTRDVGNRAKDGIVLKQNPDGGTPAKQGSSVTIVVGNFVPPTPTTTTPTTTTPTTTTPTTTTPKP